MGAPGNDALLEFSGQPTAVRPDPTPPAIRDLEFLVQLLAHVRRRVDDKPAAMLLRLHAHVFGHITGEHANHLLLEVAWSAEQLATRLLVHARLAPSEWNRLDGKIRELRAELRRRGSRPMACG